MLHHFETIKSLFQKNQQLSMASLGAIMFILLILLSIVSLGISNTKSSKGYLLNQLESKRQALVTELEINDTLILRAQSINTIEGRASHMYKARGEDIYYVVPVSALASRNK